MKYLLILSLLVLPLVAFGQETGFVPLTNTPFLADTGNSFSLEQFLNNLYRLSIGVAAVVAVLQIMRAGIMYMGGDSVTEKKEAKNLIALSIGGLVLVLSPVIVFSIINPNILSLKIGGIDQLATDLTPAETMPVCTPACTAGLVCTTGGTCISPEGEGDGTCSMNCNAVEGQICRSGQCVAITEDTCPTTPIANGVSVPSARGQRCCAAQTGCTVQARREGDVDLMICSCSAPPPPARYGWRARVQHEGGGETTEQRAPFSSVDACQASIRDWSGPPFTGEFQCACERPLSEQAGCSTL